MASGGHENKREDTMHDTPLMDKLAKAVASSPDYRLLRRVDLDRQPCLVADDAGASIGVVIDVETNGLDPERHRIIELALRRFRYDVLGNVTRVDRAYSWLEDPGEPLDPKITALTGLTDRDVAAATIDDRQAVALIDSADVRIAFNARFDRRFVERRLPAVAGRAWACAMREVDWNGRFAGGGRALGWLLAQCGWFHGAHRAAADVDATIVVLQHWKGGVTALAELLSTASSPTWAVTAYGAHFAVKDKLRTRGYHWDAAEKVWAAEVAMDAVAAERSWLAENVYAPEHMPRADGPVVRAVTWETRHGR